MDGVSFEPSVIADRPDECNGHDSDVGIDHLDAQMLRLPRFRAEGVESEHGLIHPHQLHVPESGDLDGVVHLPRKVVVVLVGVVDDLLAAVDKLELDTKLLVGPLEQGGRDLNLWESSVKLDGPLHQGEMGPLS